MYLGLLVKYEFRKFFSRFNLILIIVGVILTLGLTVLVHLESFTSDYKEFNESKAELLQIYNERPEEYAKMLKKHNDKVEVYRADEMIATITGDIKGMPIFENQYIDLPGYGDRKLFNEVEKVIQSNKYYKDTITSALRDAVSRLKGADDGTYLEDYYLHFCTAYSDVVDLEFPVDEVKGWNEYFSFRFVDILLIIVLIATVSTVFTVDQRAGMGNILHIMKYGDRHVIAAKLIFVIAASGSITVLFSALPMAVFGISCGLSSVSHPIQMVDALISCPVRITIGQYLIIYFLLRVLFFTTFTLLTAVVNQFVCNEKFSFVTAIVLIISGYFISGINYRSPYYFLQKYSITEISGITILFERYRGLNIAERCFDYMYTVLIAVFVLLILVVICSLFIKRESVAVYSEARHINSKSAFSMSLFHTEAYKNLIGFKYILLILIAVLIKSTIAGVYYKPSDAHGEKQYRGYIETVAGEITDEKLSWIEEEEAYIETALFQYDEAHVRFREGKLSAEEMKEYEKRKNYADYYRVGCDRLGERRDYLIRISSEFPEVEFIYDEGLERFFLSSIDIIAAFLIVFMGSNLFSCEYERGFDKIMRTTRNGRNRIFTTKLCYTLVMATVLFIIFGIIDLCFVGYYYDTYYLSVPIQSMPVFEGIKENLSIGEYLIIDRFVSLFGFIIAYVFSIAVSILIKNNIKAAIIVSFSMFIPFILSQTSVVTLAVFDFIGMISPDIVMRDMISYISCAATAIILWVTARSVWCGRRTSK